MTRKEFESVLGAIDFIINAADGADEDKYPHDILDGLRSLVNKYNRPKKLSKRDVQKAYEIAKQIVANN